FEFEFQRTRSVRRHKGGGYFSSSVGGVPRVHASPFRAHPREDDPSRPSSDHRDPVFRARTTGIPEIRSSELGLGPAPTLLKVLKCAYSLSPRRIPCSSILA